MNVPLWMFLFQNLSKLNRGRVKDTFYPHRELHNGIVRRVLRILHTIPFSHENICRKWRDIGEFCSIPLFDTVTRPQDIGKLVATILFDQNLSNESLNSRIQSNGLFLDRSILNLSDWSVNIDLVFFFFFFNWLYRAMTLETFSFLRAREFSNWQFFLKETGQSRDFDETSRLSPQEFTPSIRQWSVSRTTRRLVSTGPLEFSSLCLQVSKIHQRLYLIFSLAIRYESCVKLIFINLRLWGWEIYYKCL